jgi:uracil-DNA glycosylase family 4
MYVCQLGPSIERGTRGSPLQSYAMTTWDQLQQQIVACERCPRLRSHCKTVAEIKRFAFREQTYWGKPLPNLGEPTARVLIVGLAPAAHGGNRTGRMFTGDRSGDFLFRALYEAGFANQPQCTHPDDGLKLLDLAITAIAHCAPPANKPTPLEITSCFPFLEQTIDAMPNLRGIVALGRIAFDGCVRLYRAREWLPKGPKPEFGHGALYQFPNAPFLLASFHPSQQNTFTGKLTPAMLRSVFLKARKLLGRVT